MREAGDFEYKVSLRAKGEIDVAEVAQAFGGGGHRNAAGFMTKGSLEAVKARVIEALKGTLSKA